MKVQDLASSRARRPSHGAANSRRGPLKASYKMTARTSSSISSSDPNSSIEEESSSIGTKIEDQEIKEGESRVKSKSTKEKKKKEASRRKRELEASANR